MTHERAIERERSWEPVFGLRMQLPQEMLHAPGAQLFMRRFCEYWNTQMTDAWDFQFDENGTLLCSQRYEDYGLIGFAPWNVFAALQHFLQEELHVESPYLPAASASDDVAERFDHREKQLHEVWQWVFDHWNTVTEKLGDYEAHMRRIDTLRLAQRTHQNGLVRNVLGKRILALQQERRQGFETVFDIQIEQ